MQLLSIDSKGIENRIPEKYLYIPFYSITDKSQKMEATQLFTGGWMDKQNVAYAHSGILFSLKKEGNSDINYDMDEPCGQYAKWNKLVTKRQIL